MNEEINPELVAKLIGDQREVVDGYVFDGSIDAPGRLMAIGSPAGVTDSVPVVLRFPVLRLSQEFIEDNTFDEGVGALLRSMVQDSLVDGLEVFPYQRSDDTV